MSAEYDVDQDDEADRYVRGPRRRRRSTGPVYDAYANGPSGRDCPNCGAQPGQYCHHPNGSVSTIPCLQRLSERPR